jgi:hypothetical protein
MSSIFVRVCAFLNGMRAIVVYGVIAIGTTAWPAWILKTRFSPRV